MDAACSSMSAASGEASAASAVSVAASPASVNRLFFWRLRGGDVGRVLGEGLPAGLDGRFSRERHLFGRLAGDLGGGSLFGQRHGELIVADWLGRDRHRLDLGRLAADRRRPSFADRLGPGGRLQAGQTAEKLLTLGFAAGERFLESMPLATARSLIAFHRAAFSSALQARLRCRPLRRPGSAHESRSRSRC